jgi:hypothetical protein
MPATDRPTIIVTIVYCAINTSNIERRRRRTFGALGDSKDGGVFAFNSAHAILEFG